MNARSVVIQIGHVDVNTCHRGPVMHRGHAGSSAQPEVRHALAVEYHLREYHITKRHIEQTEAGRSFGLCVRQITL